VASLAEGKGLTLPSPIRRKTTSGDECREGGGGGGSTANDDAPDFDDTDPCLEEAHTTLKQTYRNTHAYHINSISLNNDGETFLSADDLRINLMNMEDSNRSFSKW
jgi:hypothetical protein